MCAQGEKNARGTHKSGEKPENVCTGSKKRLWYTQTKQNECTGEKKTLWYTQKLGHG